ncbi:putative G-protein coupled receptor F59B2.13 [Aplysia californica]|uniref:G-protein coupled receptor F59B2.13 n=1 Tax=Aplysia californica TaxID=6500 RepID=A0ABM1VYJ8_APLCA|nr:putative G-protein coupled receptor F59B2.13 [Aplysia californica]
MNFAMAGLEALHYNSSILDWEAMGYDVVRMNFPECKFGLQVLWDNGTPIILHAEEDVQESYSMCQSRLTLRLVIPWLILAIGVPANLVALFTMLRMKKSTGTCYVALLAAADMTNILVVCPLQIFGFGQTDALCKMSQFLTNFTGCFANWTLVLICLERWITVRFPLQKNFYFTFRRAWLAALILGIVLLIPNAVYLATVGVSPETNNECGILPEHLDAVRKYLIPTTSYLYVPIPAGFLFLFIILIAVELRKLQRSREEIMGAKSYNSSSGNGNIVLQRQLADQARTEHALTIMLLIAAFTFVLLTLPLFLVTVKAMPSYFKVGKNPLSSARFFMFHTVAKGLEVFSHAINFFIYFLSARKFRSELLKNWCCFRAICQRLRCCPPGISNHSEQGTEQDTMMQLV